MSYPFLLITVSYNSPKSKIVFPTVPIKAVTARGISPPPPLILVEQKLLLPHDRFRVLKLVLVDGVNRGVVLGGSEDMKLGLCVSLQKGCG